jgi:endoglucanase
LQAGKLWRVISERYKAVGPELRFEILNEPIANDPADLTRFYSRILGIIREVSPQRTVLVCSNQWGSFHTVQHLEPLLDDPHVVIAVHYYEPHVFTHQGASWVELDHDKLPPIKFPGTVPDMMAFVGKDHYAYALGGTELTVESIEKEFNDLAEWATAKGAELHLGEFGVYEAADKASRQRWYRTVLEQCDKHGIGWAVWDYKGGFGVRDGRSGKASMVQEVINDLVPGP